MKEIKKGLLFVISGPSGTGKGAICAGLIQNQRVVVSISMTTRAPRPHETEGKSYFFTDKERFLEILENGGFVEHAQIYGEYYGTPKGPLQEQLDRGTDVILEIDVNGAMQVKKSMPDAVFVFIMPPSPEELRRRIEKRGTETKERIACRLARSDAEIAQVGKYDYCVVNDKLNKAIKDVGMIIKAERARSEKLQEPDHYGQVIKRAVRRADELRVNDGWESIIDRYNTGGKNAVTSTDR